MKRLGDQRLHQLRAGLWLRLFAGTFRSPVGEAGAGRPHLAQDSTKLPLEEAWLAEREQVIDGKHFDSLCKNGLVGG